MKTRGKTVLRCGKCKRTKPVSLFYGPYRGQYGPHYLSFCRKCWKAYAKAYYEKHREQHKASTRACYRLRKQFGMDKADLNALRESSEAARDRIDQAIRDGYYGMPHTEAI